MKTSEKGLKLIKHFEGSHTEAYVCPAGKLTIGVGHTGSVDGKPITKGLEITSQKVDELLRADLINFEKGLTCLLKVPVNQNQFDAMVSLAFNIGLGSFKKSSVLRYVNIKNFGMAETSFLLWNKGGGRVLQGLVRRRSSEAILFSTGRLTF